MGGTLVGRGIAVSLGGVKTGVLVGRPRCRVDVAAAQVISDVTAAVVVVGVVDQRLDFPVEVATRVDYIQTCDTALECQCSEIKLVDVLLWLEFRRVFVAKAGVHQERAFNVQLLRRVLNQRAPVFRDIPLETNPIARVGCLIPVVFHHFLVAGRIDDRVREVAEVRPITDGVSVNDRARWRKGSRSIVDPAALAVVIADGPDGHVLANGHVDHALDIAAGVATVGR